MSEQQADKEKIIDFIFTIYERSAPLHAVTWLSEKLHKVGGADSDKALFLAFSAASRFAGKGLLQLKQDDLENAEALRPGFNPTNWTLAQAARTLLLLPGRCSH